jgi:hypothetical protein
MRYTTASDLTLATGPDAQTRTTTPRFGEGAPIAGRFAI